MRLGGRRTVALPEGPTELASIAVDQIPRAQQVVWSPDGVTLVVQLPSGWRPDLEQGQPLFTEIKAGELWRWTPGRQQPQKLVDNVDFASPLLWLPAVA